MRNEVIDHWLDSNKIIYTEKTYHITSNCDTRFFIIELVKDYLVDEIKNYDFYMLKQTNSNLLQFLCLKNTNSTIIIPYNNYSRLIIKTSIMLEEKEIGVFLFNDDILNTINIINTHISSIFIKRNNLCDIGVVCGRFQGLHYGHMEYILNGLCSCKHLIIGITNYLNSSGLTKEQIKYNNIDNHRLNIDSNPFTYYERVKMIRIAMKEYNVSEDNYTIVPFPIEDPKQINKFIPKESVIFLTIYDEWGKGKKHILQKEGYKTNVLWERSKNQKPISGTIVRDCAKNNGKLEYLVTPNVSNYIREMMNKNE